MFMTFSLVPMNRKHPHSHVQTSSVYCSLFTDKILHTGKHILSASNCGYLGYDTVQSGRKLQEEQSMSIFRTHVMVSYSTRAR
jgi:hypothetical protein